MGYKEKAIKRTGIVFFISILAAFIGYLIRLVFARNLTPADYGLFFAVFTLFKFSGLFWKLGLDESLIKYIPEFQVKKRNDLIKSSISISLIISLLLALIISAFLIIFSDFLANTYFENPLAKVVLIIFAVITIASVFENRLWQIFNAFQKMVHFSFMYLFNNIAILTLSVILFQFGLGVLSPSLAYLGAYILGFFIFLPFFLRIYPFFKYKSKFSKELTKKLVKFGVPTTISSIGLIIILYTDTLILTYFGNLTEVGIYNVMVPTAMLLAFFGSSIGQVIFPMISELWTKQLKEYITEGTNLLMKYSFLAIMPVALIMFSFPELLIKLLFGPEYLGNKITLLGSSYFTGALTLQLLVIGLIFYSANTINTTILKGIGKPKLITKIILIGAIFNLITNFYFIPKYGMLGAGLTSLVSYFLILILSLFYLTKNIKLKLPWLSWIKTFFLGIIFILIIYLLKNRISTIVYLEAFICIVIAGIVYTSMLFLLKVISLEEVKDIIRNIK